MINVICNETDHDSKTFARNLVFERENPELLNQSELEVPLRKGEVDAL